MANKTFNRITKAMNILLALCFVMLVTAASVSAYATVDGDTNDKNTTPIHHEENKHGYKENKGMVKK
jgi:hypothetical protein